MKREQRKQVLRGSTYRLLTPPFFSTGKIRWRTSQRCGSYSLGPKKMVMIMIGDVVPYIGDTFLYGRRSLRS